MEQLVDPDLNLYYNVEANCCALGDQFRSSGLHYKRLVMTV